ncbi:MAG: DUF2974 domain-containing protein [Mogibacterium sp.]|nr:DUF2974 domain-containing protein [Mogibacterium sp.]
MFSDGITDENNRQLFTHACASPRYRDLEVKQIASVLDESRDLQFAAMTFVLDADTEFVAFRGTDGTLAGWEEDFNLAFLNEIPAQTEARRYLEALTEDRQLLLGGHSKGGNLAIFSAMTCRPDIRQRIRAVYSLDAPGFRDEVIARFAAVPKPPVIRRLVPQSSIIGMLLQAQDEYKVVQSNAISIQQHSAYSWQVSESDFIYLEELSSQGAYFDRTLHSWLLELDDEHRALFVRTIFGILEKNDLHELKDFKRLRPSDIAGILDSIRDVDRDTLRTVQKILGLLIKEAVRKIPDREE